MKLRMILLFKWLLKIQPPFLGRKLFFTDVIFPPLYMIVAEEVKRKGFTPMSIVKNDLLNRQSRD
ncbi:hypothetical protein ETI10_01695 [Macrococcoides goetzii]|nr:hypothetical protein [Macrococcus goetzii]TDM41825.1 hypothetical protein ETI10_01695 [Macrococcus goetzii]